MTSPSVGQELGWEGLVLPKFPAQRPPIQGDQALPALTAQFQDLRDHLGPHLAAARRDLCIRQ